MVGLLRWATDERGRSRGREATALSTIDLRDWVATEQGRTSAAWPIVRARTRSGTDVKPGMEWQSARPSLTSIRRCRFASPDGVRIHALLEPRQGHVGKSDGANLLVLCRRLIALHCAVPVTQSSLGVPEVVEHDCISPSPLCSLQPRGFLLALAWQMGGMVQGANSSRQWNGGQGWGSARVTTNCGSYKPQGKGSTLAGPVVIWDGHRMGMDVEVETKPARSRSPPHMVPSARESAHQKSRCPTPQDRMPPAAIAPLAICACLCCSMMLNFLDRGRSRGPIARLPLQTSAK